MINRSIARMRRFMQIRREIGTMPAFRYAVNRLKHNNPLQKIDVCGFYNFIVQEPFGECSPAAAGSKILNWFIPDFGIGSGGHLNIFRFIHLLEAHGYQSNIIIVGTCRQAGTEEARRIIRKHFAEVSARVYIGTHNLPSAETTIATGWQTAYYVKSFRATRNKCYFVQDFEPMFYSLGSEYQFAENTYRFGFYGITAGHWLTKKLQAEYDMPTRNVGFSVEHERYHPGRDRRTERPTLFFYARPPTPRRAFELGLLVLEKVSKILPGFHCILAGWDTNAYQIPFSHTNAGILSLENLPDIYRGCDAALVISLTNLSLLPLELMACGCPVISNRGENVEWLLDDQVALLAHADVDQLSAAIVQLLTDPDLRQKLVQNGLARCQQSNWQDEAAHFAAALAYYASASELSQEGLCD